MHYKLLVSMLMLVIQLTVGKPILDYKIGILTGPDGQKTILRYLDLPSSITESIDLECRLPLANYYEWILDAKTGSPFAGSVRLGTENPDIEKPWKFKVSKYLSTDTVQYYKITLVLLREDLFSYFFLWRQGTIRKRSPEILRRNICLYILKIR